MQKQNIRNTAAIVLAASVFETFPEVLPLQGGSLSYGFYYDFYFPHSVHPELLHSFEEKMRQVVREKRDIRTFEMVSISAKGFLKSKGFFEKSKEVEGDGLFSLVQLGDFIDLSSGPFLENSCDLAAFKLREIVELEDKIIRVVGFAETSKETLKEFVKKFNVYEKNSHIQKSIVLSYACQLSLGFALLENGIEQATSIVMKFQENLPLAFRRVETPGIACDKILMFSEILKKLPESGVFEVCAFQKDCDSLEDFGLLDPGFGKKILMSCSYNLASSFLQSIGKTLNILGFSYDVSFFLSKKGQKQAKSLETALKSLNLVHAKGSTEEEFSYVDFLVRDGLGRSWSAVRVFAASWVYAEVIVERNLALLLEKNSI